MERRISVGSTTSAQSMRDLVRMGSLPTMFPCASRVAMPQVKSHSIGYYTRDWTANTSTSNGYASGYCMFFYYVSRLGRMKQVLSHKLWFPWKDQYYYRLAYLQKSVIHTSVQSVKVFASKRMSLRKGLAWDKLSSKSLPNFLNIMLGWYYAL